MRWPIGIGVVLAAFVSWQAVFIWIAVSNQDDVVESYRTEKR